MPQRHRYAINSNPTCLTRSSLIAKASLVHRSIAAPVLPACPPPLLPPSTIKALLAQLHINRIMRLAHPPSELVSIAHPRLIALLHPFSEIIGADPAWVHLAEQADELLRLDLSDQRGLLRIVGCHCVE